MRLGHIFVFVGMRFNAVSVMAIVGCPANVMNGASRISAVAVTMGFFSVWCCGSSMSSGMLSLSVFGLSSP